MSEADGDGGGVQPQRTVAAVRTTTPGCGSGTALARRAEGSAQPLPAGAEPTDAQLIGRVRAGDLSAFGQLYKRYHARALVWGCRVARHDSDAADLVAAAFVAVLDQLRAGRGPDTAFASYLHTVIRHRAVDVYRAEQKVTVVEDLTAVLDRRAVEYVDPVVAREDRALASAAFATLRPRWQAALRLTVIEQIPAVEAATTLGVGADACRALTTRAREALRAAYLQASLSESGIATGCASVVALLGAWTRRALAARDSAAVATHLVACTPCRDRALALRTTAAEFTRAPRDPATPPPHDSAL